MENKTADQGMAWVPYVKKRAQLMRAYIPGEDLEHVGVPMGVVPELGGMIAMNPEDPEDVWYITPEFFAENYAIAPMEHDDDVGSFPELIDDPDTLINELSFGEALVHLYVGHRLARKGWNGRGMWISYTPGITLDAEVDNIWTDNVRRQAIDNGGTIELRPYLLMKTVEGHIQIGWQPSQSDALANDWMVVQ